MGLSNNPNAQNAAPAKEQKGKGKSDRSKSDPAAKKQGAGEKRYLPCSFFPKGDCWKGADCLFLHNPKSKPKAQANAKAKAKAEPKADASGDTSQIPCKFNTDGRCKLGAECLFKHEGQKPKAKSIGKGKAKVKARVLPPRLPTLPLPPDGTSPSRRSRRAKRRCTTTTRPRSLARVGTWRQWRRSLARVGT